MTALFLAGECASCFPVVRCPLEHGAAGQEVYFAWYRGERPNVNVWLAFHVPPALSTLRLFGALEGVDRENKLDFMELKHARAEVDRDINCFGGPDVWRLEAVTGLGVRAATA